MQGQIEQILVHTLQHTVSSDHHYLLLSCTNPLPCHFLWLCWNSLSEMKINSNNKLQIKLFYYVHDYFVQVPAAAALLSLRWYELETKLLNSISNNCRTIFSSEYICLIWWLPERVVPTYVLLCLCVAACVCSLLSSQDRFWIVWCCSPARPPAAGDRSTLRHPNLTPY